MELKEQISYLQGLADGLDVNKESKEGRLIREMLDVLADMADSLTDMEARQDDLEEYTETISEDLSELEDEVYDEFDDDEDDDECTCGHAEGFIDVECPKCHEIVCFEEDILDDEDVAEVTCPNCGEVVFVNDGEFLEIDEDDDEEK